MLRCSLVDGRRAVSGRTVVGGERGTAGIGQGAGFGEHLAEGIDEFVRWDMGTSGKRRVFRGGTEGIDEGTESKKPKGDVLGQDETLPVEEFFDLATGRRAVAAEGKGEGGDGRTHVDGEGGLGNPEDPGHRTVSARSTELCAHLFSKLGAERLGKNGGRHDSAFESLTELAMGTGGVESRFFPFEGGEDFFEPRTTSNDGGATLAKGEHGTGSHVVAGLVDEGEGATGSDVGFESSLFKETLGAGEERGLVDGAEGNHGEFGGFVAFGDCDDDVAHLFERLEAAALGDGADVGGVVGEVEEARTQRGGGERADIDGNDQERRWRDRVEGRVEALTGRKQEGREGEGGEGGEDEEVTTSCGHVLQGLPLAGATWGIDSVTGRLDPRGRGCIDSAYRGGCYRGGRSGDRGGSFSCTYAGTSGGATAKQAGGLFCSGELGGLPVSQD